MCSSGHCCPASEIHPLPASDCIPLQFESPYAITVSVTKATLFYTLMAINKAKHSVSFLVSSKKKKMMAVLYKAVLDTSVLDPRDRWAPKV